MRVALLSCGPSLRRTWPPTVAGVHHGYDATIGINSVPADEPVDWWCFGDWPVFERYKPIGHPAIFGEPVMLDKARRLYGENVFAGFRTRAWTDEPAPTPGYSKWRNWSATAALVLAAGLGARTIDCYGVDLAGDTDYRGQPCHGRHDNRWARERAQWDQTAELLGTRGLHIRRIAPDTDAWGAAGRSRGGRRPAVFDPQPQP
jgi:hypothetical protein